MLSSTLAGNPKGATWGNMSWGHATSKDLIHWRSSTEAVIEPGTEYDHKGIFTGCVLMQSPSVSSPRSAGEMTAIYTAVSHLPIHHTLDYHRGAEKLALSTSSDGGQTWVPHGCILDGPPADEDIISWRDPYVAPWALLDRHLGRSPSNPGLYGLIAGGIRDKTPTVFAYDIDPNNVGAWRYIGHLCDVGRNYKAEPYGVDMGKNWEVANFFTIANEDEYLLINVEGCTGPGPQRAAIYMRYGARMGGSGIRLEPESVGMLDHGCLYAASSFVDPVRQRRILWGWITEDDMPEEHYDVQGWSGCLSLPRELFKHPVHADLGIRPAAQVDLLRVGALHTRHTLTSASASASVPQGTTALVPDVYSRSLEILATDTRAGAGLVLAHSADLATRTVVYLTETQLVVDRSSSVDPSLAIKINTATLTAPLPATQTHTLRVFLDNSVLEIFVDDVVALSTRIYPADDDCRVSALLPPTPNASLDLDIWSGLSKAHIGFF